MPSARRCAVACSVDDDQYTFRHALLREAVHDDLLPGERTRLHRAYAEALEARIAVLDRCDRSTLAHHWRLAQVPDRALVASVAAMNEAKNRFAFATAARFGELALELWEQVPDAATAVGLSQVHLMRQIGSILRNAGESERALSVAERALDLIDADVDADPAEHARLLRDKAQFRSNLGLPGSKELYLQALEIVDAAVDDDRLHATLLNQIAGKHMLDSMPREAIITATQALELAQRVDDPYEISVAHNLRGTCRAYLGQLDEAFADYREAERFASLGNGGAELRYLVNYSDILALLGRHHEAFEVAEAGVARARELGVERATGTLLVQNVVEPLLTLGDIDGATARLADVPIGRPQVLNDQYVVLTRIRVLAWQGNVDEAERLREEWLPSLRRTGELERQAWYRIIEDEIALAVASGEWSEALDAVVEMTEDRGFVLLHTYRMLLESGWLVAEVRASGRAVDEAVAAIRRLWSELPVTVRSDGWATMLDAMLDPRSMRCMRRSMPPRDTTLQRSCALSRASNWREPLSPPARGARRRQCWRMLRLWRQRSDMCRCSGASRPSAARAESWPVTARTEASTWPMTWSSPRASGRCSISWQRGSVTSRSASGSSSARRPRACMCRRSCANSGSRRAPRRRWRPCGANDPRDNSLMASDLAGIIRALSDGVAVEQAEIRSALAGDDDASAALFDLAREVEALRQRSAELRAVMSSTRDLLAIPDADLLLQRIVDRAHELMEVDVTYLSVYDSERDELFVRAATGTISPRFLSMVVPAGVGLASLAVRTQHPQWVEDYASHDSVPHDPVVDSIVHEEQLRSLLGAPLVVNGVVLGVLFAASRRPHSFRPDEVALLSAFAGHAALVLHLAQLLRRATDATAEAAFRQREAEWAATLHGELTRLVVFGHGAEAVVGALAEALGRAVTFIDGEELPSPVKLTLSPIHA